MHYDSLKAFKSNVKTRVKHLNITLEAAAKIANRNKGWLIDLTRQCRYQQRLGSDIIDEVSMLLGVPPWEIIYPESDMTLKGWTAPEWIVDPDNGIEIDHWYMSGLTMIGNVKRRLEYMNVKEGVISEYLGYRKKWLYGFLMNPRKNGRIGTDMLDKFALYFASPPWALIHEDYDPKDYTEPDWLSIIRYRQQQKKDKHRDLNL